MDPKVLSEVEQQGVTFDAIASVLRAAANKDAATALKEAHRGPGDTGLSRHGAAQFNSTAYLQPIVQTNLIPRAGQALRLVLDRLGELDARSVTPGRTLAAALGGLILAYLINRALSDASMVLKLRFLLPWGDTSQRKKPAFVLLSQLSDESLLQTLADGARLMEKLAWRLPAPPFQIHAERSVSTSTRYSRHGAGRVDYNVSGEPLSGILYGSEAVSRYATVLRTVLEAVGIRSFAIGGMAQPGPLEPARADALRRLAAALQRTQLLPALCGALLAAPAAPAMEEDGQPAAAALCCSNAVCSLVHGLRHIANLLDPDEGLSPAIAAAWVDVLAAPELQRLLLAAAERVAERLERETEAPGGAAGGPHESPGRRRIAVDAPWAFLFDAEIASRLMPSVSPATAAATMRWESAYIIVDVWAACAQVLERNPRAAASAALPPASRLVPLALRLTRALALSPPPPIFAPPHGMLPAVDAAFSRVCHAHKTTMMSGVVAKAVLQRAASASAAEVQALAPAALEVWAWGIRALTQRVREDVAAMGGLRVGDSRVWQSGVPDLVGVLEMAAGFAEERTTGWASLGPEARQEAAQRLAGVGLMRTLDSLLRLVAACGNEELVFGAATYVHRIASLFMLPVCRASLGLPLSASAPPPRSPPSAAAQEVRQRLPPPLPPPAWEAGRDLGVLLTAAKLLRLHQDTALNAGPEAAGSNMASRSARQLSAMLCKVALGPCGLPTLLPGLGKAHAGGGAADSSSKMRGVLEVMAVCARIAITMNVSVGGEVLVVLVDTPGDAGHESYRTVAAIALDTAGIGLAALRGAAAHLPAAEVLAAAPLKMLALAVAVLQELRMPRAGAAAAACGQATVVDAGGRLARSLVATLAALAAEPGLEPTVRTWLLVPEDAGDAAAMWLAGGRGVWWQRVAPGVGVHVISALYGIGLFDPAAAERLEYLQQAAASATAPSGMGPAAASPVLLMASQVALRDAGSLGPEGEEEEELLVCGSGQQLLRQLLESLPAGQRRLWPPRQVRLCCNPACANVEGEWEGGLKLLSCGGCSAMRYCGAACQRVHWRSRGHKEACVALKAAPDAV